MKIEHKIDDTEVNTPQFTAAKVREHVAQNPELYKGIDTQKLIQRLEAEEAAAAKPKDKQP